MLKIIKVLLMMFFIFLDVLFIILDYSLCFRYYYEYEDLEGHKGRIQDCFQEEDYLYCRDEVHAFPVKSYKQRVERK